MTIKHLVISGGGPIGLSYLGAIEYLLDNSFVNMENIESMYATSIGSIISVILSLKYDYQTIRKYVIERPWKDVFKLSAKQIMETYTNKGIYDIKIIEKTFKPLLEAKDLSINISLKEFYEYSKKDIHFFVFDLKEIMIFEHFRITRGFVEDFTSSRRFPETKTGKFEGTFWPTMSLNLQKK